MVGDHTKRFYFFSISFEKDYDSITFELVLVLFKLTSVAAEMLHLLSWLLQSPVQVCI